MRVTSLAVAEAGSCDGAWEEELGCPDGRRTHTEPAASLGKESVGCCPGVSLLSGFLFPFLTTASVGTEPQECKVS